jgi:hypothetical protein
MQINSFVIPIYFGTVKVVQSNDKDKVNKRFKIDWDGLNTTVYTQDNHNFLMVTQPVEVITPETINTIAHESVHIANWRMSRIGFKYDYENDEPFAYLVGFITEEIYKIVARK